MQHQEFYVAEQLFLSELKNDRSSSSTTTTEDESSPLLERSFCDHFLTRRSYERIQMFRLPKIEDLASQKLIQKAISWIQVIGFTKSLDFESIILSIALFYTSLNIGPVCKKTIELTGTNLVNVVCACLLLACKMTNGTKLSMGELLELIKNR